MLFSTKVQDLSPLVSSPIIRGTLLLVALMIYKLGLNVLDTNKRICFLNINENEAIHNFFYNKNNDSLIIVSIYVFDNSNSWSVEPFLSSMFPNVYYFHLHS
jgi:hypothetical protein